MATDPEIRTGCCVAGRTGSRPTGAARRFATGTGPVLASGTTAFVSVWFAARFPAQTAEAEPERTALERRDEATGAGSDGEAEKF